VSDASANGARIEWLTIPTRNRPQAVARCAESYARNIAAHRRAVKIVVADASDTEEVRREVRDEVRRVGERFGLEVFYAGSDEVRAFVGAVAAEADVDEEVVAFAMAPDAEFQTSVGCNRNALLLHTAGDAALTVDDDMICSIGAPPRARAALSLFSRRTPLDYRWFSSRDEAQKALVPVDVDAIEMHEGLLGRDVPSLVRESAAKHGVDLEYLACDPAERVSERGGRVLTTQTGLVGDCSCRHPSYLYNAIHLWASRPSLSRMLLSEAAYRRASTSREVVMLSEGPAIGESVVHMSSSLALDNRALLPPFLPAGRSEDRLFGAMLSRIAPGAFFGHVPFAMLHAPMAERVFSTSTVGTQAVLSLYDVFSACTASFAPGAEAVDDAERTRRLGAHLMELGAVPLGDFEAFVRAAKRAQLEQLVVAQHAVLDAYAAGAPAWASDVRAYVASLECAAHRETREPLIVHEVVSGASPARLAALAQRLVGRFGALLRHWVEIVGAAKTLRARGEGLAVPA
jgi:hypothetical protein